MPARRPQRAPRHYYALGGSGQAPPVDQLHEAFGQGGEDGAALRRLAERGERTTPARA